MSKAEVWPDWCSEFDCEECADWEGPPPVPLWEARRRFPAGLGFEVGHAHYLTRDKDGEPLSIPTTVVRHPGMYAQFFPEPPPERSGAASIRASGRGLMPDLYVEIAPGDETHRLLEALDELPLDVETRAQLEHDLRRGQACGYATILIQPEMAAIVLDAGHGERVHIGPSVSAGHGSSANELRRSAGLQGPPRARWSHWGIRLRKRTRQEPARGCLLVAHQCALR